MITQQQRVALAAAILKKGKSLTPDRFPAPGPDVVSAWADALRGAFDNLPFPQLWDDAVILWATRLVGDRMITPRDLRDAAYTVRDRWESDPDLRGVLARQREVARDERDRALADGTFLRLKGYGSQPRELGVPGGVRDVIGGAFGGFSW